MSKFYLYDGKLMSMRDISKSAGLSYQLVCLLINKVNIQPGHDVTCFINDRWRSGVKYIYQNKLMSTRDISEAIGRSYNLVRRPINKASIEPGHDVTSLIDDRRKTGGRSGIKYIYQGKLMGVKELSEKSWVLYSTVLRRIKSGNYPAGSDVTELALNPARKAGKWLLMGKLMGQKELSENSCVGYHGIVKRIKSGNYPPGSDVTELVLRGFGQRQMKRTQVKKGDQ
ncbi:MAG: hypothetical protein ACJAYB_000069 [Psychromonas sp.]|jgi:hypothetical protein